MSLEGKNMTHITNRIWRAGAAAAFALTGVFLAGNAHAAGTAAGTSVSNTFTLDYEVGGVEQPQIDNTADPTLFTVDRVVDVTVTSQGDTTVAPNETGAELVFSVLNSGNDNQAYEFTLEDPSGDQFDAGSLVISYFRDTNDNGTYDEGTDTLVNANLAQGADSEDVAPDETIFVLVTGNIPGTVSDGDQDDIILIATSTNPQTSLDAASTATPGDVTAADTGGNTLTGEAENVFADDAGDATGDDADDGVHSDTGAFIVASADLTATKEVFAIATEGTAAGFDCATDAAVSADEYTIPGACVEYVIEVTNASDSSSPAGDATDISIGDVLPDDITFVGFSQTGFTGGTLATTPATCTAATASCTVSLTGATLAASGTPGTPSVGTVTIRALVE